jgi:hypothetical protein
MTFSGGLHSEQGDATTYPGSMEPSMAVDVPLTARVGRRVL